ncbi:hypothetical protein BDW02DRAFT_574868 [Decorospora gaudefroyi]|uniref:Uncharacterized protein n=1 Tax=Decorospora gaudefroyi TaxID=184978 RepID=A0A6A5JVL6_9PLEO|nr:hypothetical protein BDW02DRAFT_574868 [Decorospora gaudefroyi]
MREGKTNTRQATRGVQSPTEPSPEHSQPSRCQLLTLPRELRDEIYAWVLASTRITFGAKLEENRSIKSTINKSRPCSLALLYTCKQIKG